MLWAWEDFEKNELYLKQFAFDNSVFKFSAQKFLIVKYVIRNVFTIEY